MQQARFSDGTGRPALGLPLGDTVTGASDRLAPRVWQCGSRPADRGTRRDGGTRGRRSRGVSAIRCHPRRDRRPDSRPFDPRRTLRLQLAKQRFQFRPAGELTADPLGNALGALRTRRQDWRRPHITASSTGLLRYHELRGADE